MLPYYFPYPAPEMSRRTLRKILILLKISPENGMKGRKSRRRSRPVLESVVAISARMAFREGEECERY
jgi:hypothetical protein